MSIRLPLDFNIYSDEERNHYITNNLTFTPSQKELELYANYILYGKNPSTGKSSVDEGYIEIPTKYSSYKRKRDKVTSLDELRETPGFEEISIRPLQRSIYTSPRPTIANAKKLHPENFESLSEEIARIEAQLAEKEKEKLQYSESPPQILVTQIYHLKHLLISLRSQQYLVKESVSPTLALYSSHHEQIFETTTPIEIYPLGAYSDISNLWRNPKEDATRYPSNFIGWSGTSREGSHFDFTNPHHVHLLFGWSEQLAEDAIRDGTSYAAQLLETFRYYFQKALLPSKLRDIAHLKFSKWSNIQISNYINKHYGTRHNANYISTLFVGTICPAIAAAASLHWREWDNRLEDSQWQQCRVCGQWKLKDEEEFKVKRTKGEKYDTTCRKCLLEMKENGRTK